MAGEGKAFVGRRSVLAEVAGELRRGADGPWVVWVEGEPGVGKTSLIRTVVAPLIDERRVVWAAGAEDERDLAYGVVERLTRGLGHDEVHGAGDGSSGTPSWGTRVGADPLAVGADLLAAIAESEIPVVLVIEDLQWADEESARALLFALRRLESEPVVVVLTSHLHALAGMTGWERLLQDSTRVHRIELGGLEVDELIELAEAIGVGRLDPKTAQQLRDHTAGHPLHARALLTEVGPASLAGRVGVLPAPRALATLIVARLGNLPLDARTLVAAAAVLGSPSRLVDVAAIAGLDDPVPSCDVAIEADLLEWSESQTVSFPHPLIRAAVYDDLALASRRALHLAAVGVTSGVAALEHRVAAAFGPDAELADELDALAVREDADGRPVMAARHWRRASALSPTSPERDRRVLTAVECLSVAGMPSHVLALRPEVERCDDSAYRTFGLACLAYNEGRLPDGAQLAEDAFARLEPGNLATRVAASLGFVRMVLGAWSDAVAPLQVALAGDAGWVAGLARSSLAVCYINLGRFEDLFPLKLQLEDELERGVLLRCEALTVLASIRLWTGETDRAAEHLREAVERARAGERTRMLSSSLAVLGEVNFRLGRWDDAVVAAELSVSLAHDDDNVITLPQALAVAAIVHARCGRFDLAQPHIDELATIESFLPWWATTQWLAVGRAVLAESRGEGDAMRDAVTPLLDRIAGDPTHQLPAWPWMVLVIDALLAVGDSAGAQEQLDALDNMIFTADLAAPAAEQARLLGRLAESREDFDGAEAHYRTAIAAEDAQPYTRARAQLALGRLLRRTDGIEAATHELSEARARLASLGAAPDVRRCDAALRSRDQPDAHNGGPDHWGLTAAELSVANLVVQRLTNREVAARLYISAKTVEYHLSNIYAKLGINGRRQLADRLAPHEVRS